MSVQADWFAKHRQQRPAVAAVFLERYMLLTVWRQAITKWNERSSLLGFLHKS